MKVYLMHYSAYCIGVYSRKKKLLAAFVKRCKKYRDEIIKDLENALQGNYRSDYDCMMKIDKGAIQEILNLFQGEEYDSSQFSFQELSECTDCDYYFTTLEMDT